MSHPAANPTRQSHPIWVALTLSMGAAISLGITRFSYGLLLPAMRADLHWSYTLAGAMNTANALGYLVGALSTPYLIKRWGAHPLLVRSALCAVLIMASTGLILDDAVLLSQRLLAGVVSAWMFVAGGLLAARLASAYPARGGLLLGLYYGGTGFGIILSALVVPSVLNTVQMSAHTWIAAWWALAAGCLLMSLVLMRPIQLLNEHQPTNGVHTSSPQHRPFRWGDFSYSLAAYTMFGVGYIGYMTFIIALLRERGEGPGTITVFYSLLGLAVVMSSRVWAKLLDRYKGGQSLAILNGLLGTATLLPILSHHWLVAIISGMLFGGVFLSLVASTTALVRHNLPASSWTAGISAFTVVFALGQIIGPTIVGFISDQGGGLSQGLTFSACALWLGALLAWRQKPLTQLQ